MLGNQRQSLTDATLAIEETDEDDEDYKDDEDDEVGEVGEDDEDDEYDEYDEYDENYVRRIQVQLNPPYLYPLDWSST